MAQASVVLHYIFAVIYYRKESFQKAIRVVALQHATGAGSRHSMLSNRNS
jgi:hypothetical protein